MKWLAGVFVILLGLYLGWMFTDIVHALQKREQAGIESVVKYPKEEVIAQQLCGKHRLMYWWLESPRKASATMHVRCTGQVTVVKEVDL